MTEEIRTYTTEQVRSLNAVPTRRERLLRDLQLLHDLAVLLNGAPVATVLPDADKPVEHWRIVA